jgi:hypothetical protein
MQAVFVLNAPNIQTDIIFARKRKLVAQTPPFFFTDTFDSSGDALKSIFWAQFDKRDPGRDSTRIGTPDRRSPLTWVPPEIDVKYVRASLFSLQADAAIGRNAHTWAFGRRSDEVSKSGSAAGIDRSRVAAEPLFYH